MNFKTKLWISRWISYPQCLRKFWDIPTTPNGVNFAGNELLKFSKFSVKFITSFPSSRFDWQLRNEITKFIAKFRNFKQTSETICQNLSEMHCNTCTLNEFQHYKKLLYPAKQYLLSGRGWFPSRCVKAKGKNLIFMAKS